MKLTDFGAASPTFGVSKEDEQSIALAERAQRGDYDEGTNAPIHDARDTSNDSSQSSYLNSSPATESF